jgi:hypothetical protein
VPSDSAFAGDAARIVDTTAIAAIPDELFFRIEFIHCCFSPRTTPAAYRIYSNEPPAMMALHLFDATR